MTGGGRGEFTPERIAEIEARCAAATPGPWECNEAPTSCGRAFRIGTGNMLVAGAPGCCIIYDDYGWGENARSRNAAFIAHARQDLEDLLSSYKERGEELERALALVRKGQALLADAAGSLDNRIAHQDLPGDISDYLEQARAALQSKGGE